MNDHELNKLRANLLKAAIDRATDGNVSAFGRRLGYKDGAFVRQMLNGSRPVTEKTIRQIESIPGLKGWFNSTVSANPAPEHTAEQSDLPINAQNLPLIAQAGEVSGDTLDPSKMTVQQRVRAALASKIGPVELASVIGVSIDAATDWLNGVGAEPALAHLVKMQEAYGANSVWLARGKGDPGVAVRYTDDWKPIPITNWRPVPVVGNAQLGDDGLFVDLEYPVGHGDGYIDFPSRDPNAYALKCKGDSMRPRIQAGEFVIIEPSHPYEPGDDVLVKSTDGRVMVKRYLYSTPGRLYLVSINDAHEPISIANEEIDKVHFVRAIVRPSAWRPD
ncbi:helix-turn-helix transcriptional regulator [Paraburkholderia sp. WP4_3_2]|uniref:helix-turn-helix transcriptional regulator n=1 Tax=Paraburkholderia sp. WP4_3_2 TaxID=2587162 RepID=UPI00161C36E6|nr:helix-turn-helix transcriptional regulator [Paraburkholderia sp. WP4_3_2]